VVEQVDASQIVVRSDESSEGDRLFGIDVYKLMKYQKSNKSTCMNQKPIVNIGDIVKVGDVIADGTSTENGELALGKDVLVAFMPWHGYNYEDSILISQRIVQEDEFSSIHIQEHELVARDTRLGPEEITRQLPGAAPESLLALDEDGIITLLVKRFGDRIKKPKTRNWFDISALDDQFGWIPINIKTTTTKTSDNTGNLAMCVQAYTNETLDIHRERTYENGKMSEILFQKLEQKQYNTIHKKDYYFIVLNKTDASDIIVNSVKGLTVLTPNVNNLPFQVCWDKNRVFTYEHINKKGKLFIDCLQKPKPSWKETFMANIRTLSV
jgi:hypothetical protein